MDAGENRNPGARTFGVLHLRTSFTAGATFNYDVYMGAVGAGPLNSKAQPQGFPAVLRTSPINWPKNWPIHLRRSAELKSITMSHLPAPPRLRVQAAVDLLQAAQRESICRHP